MYLCLLEIQVGSLAGAESYPVLLGWRGAVFSLLYNESTLVPRGPQHGLWAQVARPMSRVRYCLRHF